MKNERKKDPVNYLLTHSLGVRKGEKIAILYDDNYRYIVDEIISFCSKKDIPFESLQTNYHPGKLLSEKEKHILLGNDVEVVILALKNSMWHTPERKSSKYEKGKRLVNILHPGKPCDSYLADIEQIDKIGKQMYGLLQESENIHIFSESGTNLTAKINKVFYETGDYKNSGAGGDFPPGEVGFGPFESSVNGRIVYDYKIQHVGFVRDNHHVVEIINDHVEKVNGSEKYENLLNSHKIFKFISEISFGINPIWTEVKNPSSIVEEKNLGTVHFGSGGNLSYGKREGPHFDAVVEKPTVYFDSKVIIEKGQLNEKFIKLNHN